MNPASRPLVIGYGNPLGADDAVGWLVAGALVGHPRAARLDVLAVHQLQPEHAVRMAESRRVVLVDAEPGGSPPLEPGRWAVRRADRLRPTSPPFPVAEWGRRCTPLALAALAVGLYRATVPIFLVEVGVASLEAGERPCGPVLRAVPWLVDLVVALALDDRWSVTGEEADGDGRAGVQLSA